MSGSGRQGGKLKPLKAPKKDKPRDDDEEDIARKQKKKEDEIALKKAQEMAAKKGPLGKGLKKSTGKNSTSK